MLTDSGQLDPVVPGAGQIAVEKLPDEAIVFLLASCFCDSDRLLDLTPGWARVQAICDFVHQHINFGYEHARVTRTGYLGDVGTPPPFSPGDFAAWFEAYLAR